MSDSLEFEIIRHLLLKFGADVNSNSLTGLGHLRPDKVSELKFRIEEDGVVYEKPLWSAELEVASSLIRCMLCGLGDDSQPEFALVFRMDDLPSYGVRLSDDPEDFGTIRYRVAHGQWIPASLYLQATVLAGVEQISDLPLVWKRCEDDSDLHELMIDFLNNGVE